MSPWARLLNLAEASPFTGNWMSPATALLAAMALVGTRRLLPQDQRHHGRSLLVFLIFGFLLGVMRLGLIAAGAEQSIGGVMLGAVTTFCVAIGTVGTVIIVALVLLPMRARVRVPSIVRDVVQAAAFVLIAFGVLSHSGVNVASMITTAGVFTAIVGLALQNTIANLFAGLMLNLDHELGLQDWVQVGGRVGQVLQVRWRSTLLRSNDGDLIIVPNGQMLGNEVYNFSRPLPRHRMTVRVGVHYQHPPTDVRHMLVAAATDAPGVLREPGPDAFPIEFGESAVIYLLRFWIEAVGRQREIEGEVMARIWYAAKRAGIEFPYPTRTVHMVAADHQAASEERNARLRAVDRVDLFSPLEPGERAALAEGMRRVAFARGEKIIRQAEPGDSLYVIAQGEVAVALGAGTAIERVATLGPGEFFGEMSLLTGAPRSATCIAQTDVVAYVVDRGTAREVLALRPQVADEMSGLLAARQAQLEKKGGELSAGASRSPEGRKRLLSMIRDFLDLT